MHIHVSLSLSLYLYIYIYIYIERERERYTQGFQGYWSKDTVNGPQLEETTTQFVLNHKVIEEPRNGLYRKE